MPYDRVMHARTMLLGGRWLIHSSLPFAMFCKYVLTIVSAARLFPSLSIPAFYERKRQKEGERVKVTETESDYDIVINCM